ncbi:MAG: DUF4349 domain-containing protein [Myxococcota bacterium]
MGNRGWIAVLVWGACQSMGCAGTGEFTEPAAEREAREAPKSSQSAREHHVVDIHRPVTTQLIVRNYNVTIQVPDPAKALDHARGIIIEAGGDVTNADRGQGYASINAVLPRDDSERVFQTLRTLGEVTNETQGRNDMRASMHELRTKLKRLDIGEVALQELIRKTDDGKVVDALLMQLELSRRERDSARQQMNNNEDQGRGDQLYISFNVGEPLPPPIKGGLPPR